MNELIKDLGLLINATLIATPPLLLAALGSCFSGAERSGQHRYRGYDDHWSLQRSGHGTDHRKWLDRIPVCRTGRCPVRTDPCICMYFPAMQTRLLPVQPSTS